MDGGCGAVDKRPAANTNSLSTAGMKRSEVDGRMDCGWTGTKKHYGGGCAAATVARSSRKRPYEYTEHELGASTEKLYKGNYWEDPAYANKLNFFGLSLARVAANDNHCEYLHREFEAWMAGHHQQLKPDTDAPNNQ